MIEIHFTTRHLIKRRSTDPEEMFHRSFLQTSPVRLDHQDHHHHFSSILDYQDHHHLHFNLPNFDHQAVSLAFDLLQFDRHNHFNLDLLFNLL